MRRSSTSSVRTRWPPRRTSSGPRSPRARTSRWPACCAATSRAPCAAPTRRWTSPSAAAGRDRNPRPPPTACSPPSASSAINSTRPNASSARPSAAVRDTRERPLLAVHALNRVQLLSDRGEHAGALDLLHATREQLGDWPLPAPMRRAPDRRGRAPGRGDRESPRPAARCCSARPRSSLAVANALARLDLLEGEAQAARATLAAHLDDLDARHGEPLPIRAEAWLLDALALDALAEHEAAAQLAGTRPRPGRAGRAAPDRRDARRRDRTAPAPSRPPRHRPSRDGRRPLGDDRAPRPPGPARRPRRPGRAAERTRAGDPRLPAEP